MRNMINGEYKTIHISNAHHAKIKEIAKLERRKLRDQVDIVLNRLLLNRTAEEVRENLNNDELI